MTNDQNDMETGEIRQKIDDLEATIALMSRDLQDMSDVVRSQQVEIDRLVATTKRLEERGLPPLPRLDSAHSRHRTRPRGRPENGDCRVL